MVRNSLHPVWIVLLTILTVAVLFCVVTLIVASVHGNDFATEIQSWFDTSKTASAVFKNFLR